MEVWEVDSSESLESDFGSVSFVDCFEGGETSSDLLEGEERLEEVEEGFRVVSSTYDWDLVRMIWNKSKEQTCFLRASSKYSRCKASKRAYSADLSIVLKQR